MSNVKTAIKRVCDLLESENGKKFKLFREPDNRDKETEKASVCEFCGASLMSNGKCSNLLCTGTEGDKGYLNRIKDEQFKEDLVRWFNERAYFECGEAWSLERFLKEKYEQFLEFGKLAKKLQISFEDYMKIQVSVGKELCSIWEFDEHLKEEWEVEVREAVEQAGRECTKDISSRHRGGKSKLPDVKVLVRSAEDLIPLLIKVLKTDYKQYKAVILEIAKEVSILEQVHRISGLFNCCNEHFFRRRTLTVKLRAYLMIGFLHNFVLLSTEDDGEVRGLDIYKLAFALDSLIRSACWTLRLSLGQPHEDFKSFADRYVISVPHARQVLETALPEIGYQSREIIKKDLEEYEPGSTYFKENAQNVKENLAYLQSLARAEHGEESAEYQSWLNITYDENTGKLELKEVEDNYQPLRTRIEWFILLFN